MRDYRALFVAIMMLLVAAVPLAQAQDGWRTRGTWEPDTLQDQQGGFMWPGIDTDPSQSVRHVYFNAYRTQLMTSYNPNVGATGSRHQWFGETTFVGTLGFWKDCNQDGYIGSSEYGLQEYRSELLIDTSICGEVAPDSCAGGCPAGYLYPHNDGSWVREIIFIGDRANPKGGPLSSNPTYFAAPGTQMWGTFGLPGAVPPTVCPITGNFGTHNTGALLDWADCFTGFTVATTLNDVQDDTGLPVGGWTIGNAEDSDNTLNVANPAHPLLYGTGEGGEPGDGHNGGLFARDDHETGQKAERAYTVFDCDSGAKEVADPTGGDLSGAKGVKGPEGGVDDPTTPGENNLLRPFTTPNGYLVQSVEIFDANGKRDVYLPGVSTPNPDGSFYEGANETYNVATKGSCYPNGNAAPYPYFEGDTTSTNEFAGRNEADLNFIFSAGSRQKVMTNVFGQNWPADLGLAPNRELDTVGSSWRENHAFLTLPQFINRNDMSLSEAQYQTFYVRLGNAVFDANMQVPNGGAISIFGSENCSTIGDGAQPQNGWACDPAIWSTECEANGMAGHQCAVVGMTYHMRDIDCEDGALLRGVPVYASGAAIGAKCAEPLRGSS